MNKHRDNKSEWCPSPKFTTLGNGGRANFTSTATSTRSTHQTILKLAVGAAPFCKIATQRPTDRNLILSLHLLPAVVPFKFSCTMKNRQPILCTQRNSFLFSLSLFAPLAFLFFMNEQFLPHTTPRIRFPFLLLLEHSSSPPTLAGSGNNFWNFFDVRWHFYVNHVFVFLPVLSVSFTSFYFDPRPVQCIHRWNFVCVNARCECSTFCLSCPVGVRHSAWISSVLPWTQLGFLPPHVLIRYFLLSSVLIFFLPLSLSLPATPHRSCPVSSMFFICHCIGKHHACVPLLCWFASFLPFSFFLLKFLIIEMGRKYVYNALVIQLNLVVAAAKLVGCVSKDCHCRLRRRALTIHTRIVSRTKRRVALHLLKPTGCIYVSVFSGSDWRID